MGDLLEGLPQPNTTGTESGVPDDGLAVVGSQANGVVKTSSTCQDTVAAHKAGGIDPNLPRG